MIEGGLDYKTLLSIYTDHTSIVNTLWGILQVVSIALLGFVYQQKYIRRNWLSLAALSAAFLVFAIGNKEAMARSQKVLEAVQNLVANEEMLATVPYGSGMRSVLEAHTARTEAQMRRDHLFLSVGVVLLVWLPYVTGRLKNRSAAKKGDDDYQVTD
jgi:hypothetical protein